ncbi:argininosuccinate lyase, partial [Mycobacterium tuberculosis]|nr:argininosuccinate lyase [Mycobacterium tuberculosis]
LVPDCEEKACEVAALTPADLAAVDARLAPEVLACLTPEAAVAARSGYNGTAPAAVAAQIERLKAVVAAQRTWAGHA